MGGKCARLFFGLCRRKSSQTFFLQSDNIWLLRGMGFQIFFAGARFFGFPVLFDWQDVRAKRFFSRAAFFRRKKREAEGES
ncbi:MAG: hypothetical protein DBX55_09850 [Verrucomicrobia bacterium]|nr:MAG: hypothetical protein DBX55_09850 [Verrucomicrobiota bacterium]